MKATRTRAIWLWALLAASPGFAQAPLPTAWTGPWQFGVPPAGWTFSGLGIDPPLPDYDGINNGAAKLDGTGDNIAIHFNGSAEAVTYWVKSLVFSGGVFQVEQSVDGTNWSALATYTELPATAAFRTNFPSLDARHIRFIYTMKEPGTGNVGLDGITVLAYVAPPVPPIIDGIATTGGAVRVSILESVVGRTYALEHAVAITAIPVDWRQDDLQPGVGGRLVLRDLTPTNAVRYYRVRDVPP